MNFISYLKDEEFRFFSPLHKYRNAGIQLSRIRKKKPQVNNIKSFIEIQRNGIRFVGFLLYISIPNDWYRCHSHLKVSQVCVYIVRCIFFLFSVQWVRIILAIYYLRIDCKHDD